MGIQHEKKTQSALLNENGHLIEPGYALSQVWKYDRSMIKGSWFRIKEWDYYYVLDPVKQYGITFTISDLGYMGLMAVCWLDFKTGKSYQTDTMIFFPKGKTNLPPSSSEGSISFSNKVLQMDFDYNSQKRILNVKCPKFKIEGKITPLTCELELSEDPNLDSMNIATSWEKDRTAFYYNQKINCMPAKGTVTLGDEEYLFSPETSMGGLDWGRGKWTYKNRWFWGSASGFLNGESFGWNIGYGFSDRSVASENMVFYKGKAHKLDEITFHYNEKNYMDPWKISSNDGRFELDFTPIIDRAGNTNFLVLKSIQHQVFGYFNGKITLDDGTVLEIKNFLGFAEDVLNWW